MLIHLTHTTWHDILNGHRITKGPVVQCVENPSSLRSKFCVTTWFDIIEKAFKHHFLGSLLITYLH